MFRQKSGRIINISSVVGHQGNAGQVPYTMEKAGLDAMTRSLALELMDRGILVNSVAPGFIDTAMTAELPAEIREMDPQADPARAHGHAARKSPRWSRSWRPRVRTYGDRDPRERRALPRLIGIRQRGRCRKTMKSLLLIALLALAAFAADFPPYMADAPDPMSDRQSFYASLAPMMPETVEKVTCHCCNKPLGRCYRQTLSHTPGACPYS